MFSADALSTRDFNRLTELIYELSGIRMGPEKKVMLEGRIKRRLAALSVSSYREYCELLFSRDGQDDETIHLIDVVTTNKTDFFREKSHFEILAQKVLPEFERRVGNGREFIVWSAGCSSGEEPYTLAMVLNEYAAAHSGFRFRILGTDISTKVLSRAQLGVFNAEVTRPVPPELRRKYFMRSRDPESSLLRVVPELRALIEFRRLNLMEEFGIDQRVDAIFCRNVVIYFDRSTQAKLFHRFFDQLTSGGYLFVGHSESLHNMDVPLLAIAPSLYRKADARNQR